MTTTPPIADIARYLTAARFDPAEHGPRGNCIVAGFVVTAGPEGCARISYQTPPDDEFGVAERGDAERGAMIGMIGDALDRSPWVTVRRTTSCGEPIVLVRRAGGAR